MQRRPDQQKTLRRAMLPVLIMAGRDDPLVPVRRQDFAAALMPYATLQVVDAAGHMPSLEQPLQVSAALEAFLEGPAPARPIATRPG
jgi:pimeloyl-ACP methyl ester carboxylesterase